MAKKKFRMVGAGMFLPGQPGVDREYVSDGEVFEVEESEVKAGLAAGLVAPVEDSSQSAKK